ncbi:phosphatase PAP2 family protein [Nocardioides sp.]|uniref:phosphatase PAP2 family protein n=1 Tax=Nocardioides sp. TaxID=35761 RepID=UPI0039E5C0F1
MIDLAACRAQLERRSGLSAAVLRAGRELTLVTLLWMGYHWGRVLASGERATAFGNAKTVHHLEQVLQLPSEASLQALVGSETLFRMANLYYIGVHFPLTVAFLLFGYFFRPFPEYRWARNLLALLTAFALVIHLLMPTAPPRMFPQWGFIDTMNTIGPSAYKGSMGEVANQFAAMPSLHIGWAVLIAVVVTRTGPWWLGFLARIHAVVTVAVVVVTANHWWLDGFVAVALLCVALVLVPGPCPGRACAKAEEDQSALPAR